MKSGGGYRRVSDISCYRDAGFISDGLSGLGPDGRLPVSNPSGDPGQQAGVRLELFECKSVSRARGVAKAELSDEADSENDLGGSSETMYYIGLDVTRGRSAIA